MSAPNKQNKQIKTVAILGGGPAACVLATLLARQGIRVAILHRPRAAALLVGESLVPAIILILRRLGVEEEVREYGKYKPGAIFNMNEFGDFPFTFRDFCGPLPDYAYNVPRLKFEATLMAAAQRAGAKVIETEARVERVTGTDQVKLSSATLAALSDFIAGEPDLIVDATGRGRVLPKLLEIPSHEGGRKDTALFAHLDRAELYKSGYVHSSRLDHGWSWRIPLQDRVSLGIVIPSEHATRAGTTPEELYDTLLKRDSVLRTVTAGSTRLTPVMEYTNYQLVSARLVGNGWALLGDTAGFIDPVFSSGLLIGMTSATELAEAIQTGTEAAFKRYEYGVIHHLKTWHEIVGYFYDGRMFTSFRVGESLRKNLLMRACFPHINKHMGRIFTGAAGKAAYSMAMMRFLMKYGLKNEDPRAMAIR
ncbi:MAG: NAD(P)/FAD-dependent oxidoreductase [Verrucomicrobiota bacterium]